MNNQPQKHDFAKSLRASHAVSDCPVWETIYRAAFGEAFAAMVDHREDGLHQRAGIDRSVILQHGKQVLIDEKARFRDFPDILLEFQSDKRRNTPGWVCKPLLADYIAYAVLPLGRAYLLPVIQLQRAWTEHGEFWREVYGIREAQNNGWVTVNCPVPVNILFKAIGQCLRVEFEPIRDFAAA